MSGVLNEVTGTVHKREPGIAGLRAACGATRDLNPDRLRQVAVERAAAEHNATKCGRCFDEGGGY